MFVLKIMVEISARHIHLSESDFIKLFGENYNITLKKQLSQPGQFVSKEKLTLIGPKGEISRVSVLGPFRSKTQVEISLTDAIKLGINTKIRNSGDLKNTPGCTLVGMYGKIDLKEGVIVAKRHIHLSDEESKKNNLNNGEIVSVKINSNKRSLIFGDITVRVNKKFSQALHIDTDEANAANIKSGTFAEIIK